jgi:hypothetical protein
MYFSIVIFVPEGGCKNPIDILNFSPAVNIEPLLNDITGIVNKLD